MYDQYRVPGPAAVAVYEDSILVGGDWAAANVATIRRGQRCQVAQIGADLGATRPPVFLDLPREDGQIALLWRLEAPLAPQE